MIYIDPRSIGKIRYAVVGAGWISQEWMMPAVENTRNSVIAALVTGSSEKAHNPGTRYEFETFSDTISTMTYLALAKWQSFG